MGKEDSKFIATALKRFNLAAEAEADTRKKSLDDLKFRAGDQWPVNVRQARDVDKRPCLTINRIPSLIKQVTNQSRQNRPQLKIIATDDSTEETAEVLEGMCRYIQESSNADIAYDTARDAQVTMGFGYFRVITEYAGDDTFDQDIKIKRIKNAFTVYFDPNAVEPDYSDAKWCFIVADIEKGEFKSEYPNAEILSMELSSIGDNAMGWMTEDNIRVAEYFYVVEEKKPICLMSDGKVLDKDIADDLIKSMAQYPTSQPLTIKATRDAVVKSVKWCKMTAAEVLGEIQDWAGKYIPVIPVLGEDLDIDGKRELIGLVRDAKDPQRSLNYWRTATTEAIALAPKAPWVIAEGQIEGYENFWQNANVANYSHLPYKPTTIAGIQVPMPTRNSVEPPVQAMTMASQEAADDMRAVTGVYDQRQEDLRDASGKAINARQRQGDTSNFNYIDNEGRSVRYLGVILLDLVPKIYDAPRVVRIIHADQSTEVIKINQPTGKKDLMTGVEKIYDVRTGKYDVTVDIGPSFATKRIENADAMQTMAQSYPPLMQFAGDLMVKEMDFPGADEIAARLKKMLPPQLQDDAEEIPPQAKAMMQQQTDLIKQLTGELNRQYSKSAFKEAELASKERINNANNETKVVTEVIKLEGGAATALMQAEIDSINQKAAAMNINQPIPTVNDDIQGSLDAAKQSLAQSQQVTGQPPITPG